MDVYFQKKFNGSRVFDLSYFSFTSLTNVSAFRGACNIQTVMQKQASFLTYLNTHTHTTSNNRQLSCSCFYYGASLVLQWKEPTCNAGDMNLTCRLRRSFGEGNGKPNQYFSLENAMDGGAWGCQRVRHNLVLNNKIYDFYYAY